MLDIYVKGRILSLLQGMCGIPYMNRPQRRNQSIMRGGRSVLEIRFSANASLKPNIGKTASVSNLFGQSVDS